MSARVANRTVPNGANMAVGEDDHRQLRAGQPPPASGRTFTGHHRRGPNHGGDQNHGPSDDLAHHGHPPADRRLVSVPGVTVYRRWRDRDRCGQRLQLYGVPNCCPDIHMTLAWHWTGSGYQPGA